MSRPPASFSAQVQLVTALTAVLGVASALVVGAELLGLAGRMAAGTLAGSHAAEAIRLSVLHLVMIALAFAGVLTFLASHLGGGFTEATRNLTARVEGIGQGAFAERVPVEGPVEVRRLSTAVNAMAESLAWREQRLLHAERLSSVGTLVAGVAHEIGNPLTWLRANAELTEEDVRERLVEPGVDGSERDLLERVAEAQRMNLDAVDRLAAITTALKDVSRAPRPERHPLNVNALVDGCVLIAHHKLMHGISVRQDLKATRRVLADGAEISQVLLNLVLNAADAVAATPGSDDAAGAITIASRDEGEEVVVSVTDSGAGIPEGFRARLFQPFATTKPGGTGLGLAISHRIVTGHGGTLACESRPGEGATFTVRLPAAAPAVT